MKKSILIGFAVVAVIAIVVAIFVNHSSPGIQSDVFYIRDWNHTEYIENWTQGIQGTVIKEMPAKEKDQYSCIIEVNKDSVDIHYICYFIDKVKHPVGEVTGELKGVNIGSYNYEENIDYVRQIPVFMSIDVVEGYQHKD